MTEVTSIAHINKTIINRKISGIVVHKTKSKMCDVTSFTSCLKSCQSTGFLCKSANFIGWHIIGAMQSLYNGICSAFNIPINFIMYSSYYPHAIQSHECNLKNANLFHLIINFFLLLKSGFVTTLTSVAELTL